MLPNGIFRIIIGATSGPQSRFNENADRPVNLRLFPEYNLRNVKIIRIIGRDQNRLRSFGGDVCMMTLDNEPRHLEESSCFINNLLFKSA